MRTSVVRLVVLAVSLPLLLTLCGAMWFTPFPISETVGLLQDAGILQGETTPYAFFDPTIRSWYRPFYHLTWWLLWTGTGSVSLTLALFKLLGIASVASLAGLLIWRLRPRRWVEAAAALCAEAVLIGSPGFRENLELPLLMTLVGMPLLLIVWILMERERRSWHGPVIVALTLIAIGFKEQGLVLIPLVAAAWWLGAPGVGRGTVVAMVTLAMAYVGMRLATSGSWQPFEQDVALGFTRIAADEASARFGAFPWPLYAYNSASTVGNILFAEPTAGEFRVVYALTRNALLPWQVNHVLSSTLLTALIGWWGVRELRRNAGQPWSPESRLFLLTVVAIAASGALSFNYSRDRLGGMALVLYALSAYFAVCLAAERVRSLAGTRGWAWALALVLLAAGWQVRALGTVEDARLRADRNHREWVTNLQRRRVEASPPYRLVLDALTGQGLDGSAAQPSPYPREVSAVIGER